MSYWSRTDDYLHEHGGQAPNCPSCGRKMVVADDHGRFTCLSCSSTFDPISESTLPPRSIPQVDTSGMTDKEKAEIPAINRLHDTPTKEEKAFFEGQIAFSKRLVEIKRELDRKEFETEEEYLQALERALEQEQGE